MGEDDSGRGGAVESLRRFGASGLALLQARVELFAVEVQEERERLIHGLVLGAVAVFLFNMTAVLLTLTIVVMVGDEGRRPVLMGFCVLYGLGALVAFLVLRKWLRSKPPFSGTIAELKKDLDWLTRK